MTLIIGAEGKDFVVLAADSKGTFLEDGSRMESITEEKLIQLTDYSCVLIAGDAEIGVQLIEDFKEKHRFSKNLGISKVVLLFRDFCKKEMGHITDTILPGHPAYPDIVFLVGGVDKKGKGCVPRLRILRSSTLFFAGRHRDKVAEGVPLIARYILSKEYNRNQSQEAMGFLVAKAMRETISINAEVGGKIRMAIVRNNGVQVFNDNVVKKYMDGPEEDERLKLKAEREELEKLIKE